MSWNIFNNLLSKRLVNQSAYTLFVGVDEYDAPANSLAFSEEQMTEAMRAKIREIEQFFYANFFTPLKEGYGDSGNQKSPIEKYFVTGVLPAFRGWNSPLNATVLYSNDPRFHGVCGFSEAEVTEIIQKFLGDDEHEVELVLHTMRHYSNG